MIINKNENRYAFADGLRGLAALWVVFYHLFHGDHINQLSQFLGKTISTIVFEYGNLGVPIFFVLSGFVMAVTTNNKHIGMPQFKNFFLRRLVRISPPYYFSIAITLILLAVKIHYVDHAGVFPSLSNIAAHFLYLQGFLNYKQINVVYWTLCYEIQFYLIFGFIMFLASKFEDNSRQQFSILISSTLIGLIWLFWSSDENHSLIYLYSQEHLLFINYWYAFSAGALVGWLISKKNSFEIYAVLFCVSILIISAYKQDIFALTSAITSISLYFALKKNKMCTWLSFKWLQTLGLISYSLYLIHNSVTGISARLVRKFLDNGVLTDFIVLAFTIVSCLLLSYLMYLIIERPVIKLSQKIKY